MVNQIFNWLNTAIVIAIGIYVFKRFLIPNISQAIKVQFLFVRNLKETYQQIILEQKRVTEEIEAQKQFCHELIQRMHVWESIFAEEIIRKEQQRKSNQENIVKKYKIQLDNRVAEMTRKKITPEVIALLEKELSAYYSDAKHAHAYVDHLFKYLAKASHEQ